MKNLKNMFAWITMAVVLTVGTIGANAGILISDAPQCTDDKGSFLTDVAGIIILNAPQFAGIIIIDRTCQADGFILSD